MIYGNTRNKVKTDNEPSSTVSKAPVEMVKDNFEVNVPKSETPIDLQKSNSAISSSIELTKGMVVNINFNVTK